MELLTYFLKSAAILSLFLLVYQVLLKKETFFTLNRYYLLLGVCLAFCLPSMEFTKVIYIEMAPAPLQFEGVEFKNNNFEKAATFDWQTLLLYGYLIGVAVMAIRFMIQLVVLKKVLSSPKNIDEEGFYHIQLKEKRAPFSFFRFIAYHLQSYTETELRLIIAHEKIHGKQYHSADILLNELMLVFLWFNPLAWFYKKKMLENLEFITDRELIEDDKEQQKNYELTLLKVSTNYQAPSLANQFYQSLIKKRIVMLNRKKSNNYAFLKSLLVLPLLGFFLWSFNVEERVEIIQDQKPINEKAEDVEIGDTIKFNQNYPEVMNKAGYIDFNGVKKPLQKLKNTYLKIETFCYYQDENGQQYPSAQGEILKNLDENQNGLYIYIDENGNADYASNKSSNINKEISSFQNLDIKTNGKKINASESPRENEKIANSLQQKQKDPLYYIDGKETTKEEVSQLKPELIESVNVLKGENATLKYGKKGRYGAIEITLKKIKISSSEKSEVKRAKDLKDEEEKTLKNDFEKKRKVTIKSQSPSESSKTFILNETQQNNYVYSINGVLADAKSAKRISPETLKNIKIYTEEDAQKELNIDTKGKKLMDFELYKEDEKPEVSTGNVLQQEKYQNFLNQSKAYIILDGKAVSKKKVEQVNPERVKSIFLVEGDKATEKFGKKAKNGVLVITTR